MKLLFLRGSVPSDRPASQIAFDSLSANDDMWTQLAYKLLQPEDYGEIWYEKGERVTRYKENFVERWVPRIAITRPTFSPDVVFARGGFPYQAEEAARHPQALKIYYGAGARCVPKAGQAWDLVLVDTEKQRLGAVGRGYRALLWAKPAAENIFHPPTVPVKKRYDVIFVANWNPNAYKGHHFLLPNLKGFKAVHLGVMRKGWSEKFKSVDFQGPVARKLLPGFYAMSKVAVVLTKGKDSCARVIPEALACNCPLLVGDGTRLWIEKYLTPATGQLFTHETFRAQLAEMVANYTQYEPAAYYQQHLSLCCAATALRKKMEELCRRTARFSSP